MVATKYKCVVVSMTLFEWVTKTATITSKPNLRVLSLDLDQ